MQGLCYDNYFDFALSILFQLQFNFASFTLYIKTCIF